MAGTRLVDQAWASQHIGWTVERFRNVSKNFTHAFSEPLGFLIVVLLSRCYVLRMILADLLVPAAAPSWVGGSAGLY